MSPNTFFVYLQAIALGFKGLQLEKSAQEIRGRLQSLQNDLDDFQQDYDTLGGHIRHAANKYDEASRKLVRFGDKLQLTGETTVDRLPEGDTETSDEDE